ncbi:MAG: hydroxymethylglutaryl-CoA lyase [Bradymonadaceae bacterium]
MTSEPIRDIRLFEVGPRDGLQNESARVEVDAKVELIHRLVEAGVRDIEIGSFVHPEWVPQMADTDEVARRIDRRDGVRYWGLVPNLRGLERALEVDIDHVATFLSASETHNQKNINRSVEESLEALGEVYERADEAGCTTRGYISTAFGCPYEGSVDFGRVMAIADRLYEYGADLIVLGDTVGAGTPPSVRDACVELFDSFGTDRVAFHFHDTQGLGLANAFVAQEAGAEIFDTSLGATGGCPYAAGAAGNIGTEDFLHMLDSMGLSAGVDREGILETTGWLEESTDIVPPSDYYTYLKAKGN